MFGFGKKKPKTLWISMQDILKIMREDYEKESTFELIDFCYKDTVHRMGSCTIPLDEEPRKEDIRFVFDEDVYGTLEEFLQYVRLEGMTLVEMEEDVEVLQAGIVGGETLLSSPWGENRLSAHAKNK